MAYLFSILGEPRLGNEGPELMLFKVLSGLEITCLFLNLPDLIFKFVA